MPTNTLNVSLDTSVTPNVLSVDDKGGQNIVHAHTESTTITWRLTGVLTQGYFSANDAFQWVMIMPPKGTFDPAAAARGKKLFNAQAQCSTCHVPPIFTEPGQNLHSPAEIGIDSFAADRSPTHMYRTTPLAGLWSHQKGGFFHDGRFPNLLSVVQHYNTTFKLGLTPTQQNDLVQYLLSL